MKEFFEGLLGRLSEWYTIVGLCLMLAGLIILFCANKLSIVLIKKNSEENEERKEDTNVQASKASESAMLKFEDDIIKESEDASDVPKLLTLQEKRDNTKLIIQFTALAITIAGFVFAMII